MASVRAILRLLFALPLVTAHPTTSVPDARPTAGPTQGVGRVPVEHFCASTQRQNLSFPDGAWAAPLTRGPCAEGQWVVHDLAAEGGPRLRCALRPCPEGQVPSSGRCVSRADASASLCGGGVVQLHSTGLPCCGSSSEEPALPPAEEVPSVVDLGPVNCAQGDGGNCGKEVSDPPKSESDIKHEN